MRHRVAYLLRAISPPLSSMMAQEAALSGAFRWTGVCNGGVTLTGGA